MEFERDDTVFSSGFSMENLSASDKLFLREIIESMINEALSKSGLMGDF